MQNFGHFRSKIKCDQVNKVFLAITDKCYGEAEQLQMKEKIFRRDFMRELEK